MSTCSLDFSMYGASGDRKEEHKQFARETIVSEAQIATRLANGENFSLMRCWND